MADNLPQATVSPHLAGNRRILGQNAVTGLGFAQPRRISRMGGQFRLIDEAGNTTPLGTSIHVVIVDGNPHKSKLYFDRSKPFDPGSEEPPLCFSDNGVAPSANAMQPQAATCAGCPQNVRGSAIGLKGALITACRDQKKLAVMVSGHPGVWLLTIPPASLTNFGTYAGWVMRQTVPLPNGSRPADVVDVVTRVYFEPDNPNILQFRYEGVIPPAVAAAQDQLDQQELDTMVGKTDLPYQGVLPAPGGNGSDIRPPIPASAPAQPAPATFALPPTQTSQPAQTALASPPTNVVGMPEQTQKRRGRPKKEEAPSFTQQPQPAAAAQQNPQFGIQAPTPPNEEMLGALQDAFKLV